MPDESIQGRGIDPVEEGLGHPLCHQEDDLLGAPAPCVPGQEHKHNNTHPLHAHNSCFRTCSLINYWLYAISSRQQEPPSCSGPPDLGVNWRHLFISCSGKKIDTRGLNMRVGGGGGGSGQQAPPVWPTSGRIELSKHCHPWCYSV